LVTTNTNYLQVPELWDDDADTLVYLFPRTSGKGPSFRVDSSVYSSSRMLTSLVHGKLYTASGSDSASEKRQASLEAKMQHMQFDFELDTPPHTPEPSIPDADSSTESKGSRALSDPLETGSNENHLYVPLKLSNDDALPHPSGRDDARFTAEDIQTLVSVRNLFAFMLGQSLVATEKRSDLFSIFMNIGEQLRRYEFTNLDGSTFGEVASASFDSYVDELNLADIRNSREKTIEAIVLGERMRSVVLYNEGFVHAVGKYEDVTRLRSPKFQLISPKTQNRMERASMDLGIRQKSVEDRLNDFEFPSIFSGIMASKMAEERKQVNFEAWKNSFIATRKHVLAYYKNAYGSWPPKASSKKNSLETSGLNRLVLNDIYRDFCQLYDLLVDRNNLTSRSADAAITDGPGSQDPTSHILRRVLDEYDRSVPPFQPPIPFDVPVFPTLAATRSEYGQGDAKKDAKLRGKKLKDDEINNILKASYNQDSLKRSPFLMAFYDLERKEGHHRTVEDLVSQRVGHWIFMYAVLQALPMLVVDAPNLRFFDGVEYFLAIPPRSGVPWARTDTSANAGGANRAWYGVQGGGGVVSLPNDIVEHGVEGIYRRSHCWNRATEWTAGNAILSAAVAAPSMNDPLPPPPGNMLDPNGSRPNSRSSNRQSTLITMGLERMPLPAGVAPVMPSERPSTPRNTMDPSKTFDSILGTGSASPADGKEKKKKGKK
jgi:hypothetical protein